MDTSIKVQKFVIDASAIFSFLMIDEVIPKEVEDIIECHTKKSAMLYAPSLINFEIGSCIHSAILRKRLSLKSSTDIITQFLNLKIQIQDTSIPMILKTSIAYQLSYYDATYLSLKNSLHCPLLTLDKKLAALAH